MSWILEKKLKRHQKLREQEERRRQRLEIFSTGSSTPASSSSKTLTWKEEPKESSSLNVTINSGAPGFSTPSKRRQCVRESPSPKRGDPLLQPQTVQPTPRSSAPSVATFRKFRLSLSDDDDDDDDNNNNDNNDTHKATRTAVGTHIKDCLDHSLSLSDDDEEKEEIRESRWKKSHKIKPSPIRMVFGSAFVKDAKKSYPVGGEDDDDDDSFGDRELQEFRRLLQTQKSSTNSTNPPFQTTRSVNKLPKKSMECMDDHVEEFTPTQNDSIQDSDEETHLPTPNNRGTMNDDDSSVDKELQAVTDKLHSPISVPHNPIALAKHEAQVHAAAVQSHFASPENYNRNKNDALWSDSEPEQEDVKEDSSPSGKGKRKRKRSGGERSSCKSLSAISKANKYTATVSIDFWDDNAVLQQYGNLLLDSQVDELKEELHPTLTDPKFGPFDLEPLVLEHKSTKQGHQVPKALNRYLAPFQQDGVKFIYKCLMDNMGCVLGDDMGCGKTVQVMSLLSALFNKTGTGLDVLNIEKRKQLVKAKVQEQKCEEEKALLQGRGLKASKTNVASRTQELELPARWWPVLIVVPPTVLENWKNEFARFTHFSVATYSDRGRDAALAQITSGMADVMLTKRSTFANPSDFDAMNSIPVKWKLVIIDEFHVWKSEKSVLATNLRIMKSDHQNLVLGMTGTLMSNDHSELWNLIDLVETNYLGDWDEFKVEIAQPIKLARSKTASRDLIEISQAKAKALSDKLQIIFIRRSKEDVLKYFLPKKNEKVVMCELSPLQKQVYQHILTLPDIDNTRTANSPCDCGVNAGFFHRYQRLRTPSERFSYYRENRKQIITRGKCCYRIPLNPQYVEGGNESIVHPDAVLWRMMKVHANGEGCRSCPSCCGLPALAKLYKLGDHLALLQAAKGPGSDEVGSPEHVEYIKSLEFAKVALHHVVDRIPGQSFIRRDGIMDDHFELSGKLKVLDKLLDTFNKDGSRVLLFSYSTQSLDLIQNYLRSRGHRHLRMDGKTANSLRQDLADQFNTDPTIFIFLLSTKAMGTGLNLTSANKVIIFDVEWNPSNDEQAQDRAYRIGQSRDVEVLRMVSQGTIDELKYLRQLYKVHLKQETLLDETSAKPRAARLFRGVQGDKYRKGELFGYVNLFRFKDGSFLNDIWKKTGRGVESQCSNDLVMHEASKLSDALLGIGSDKVDEVLDDESTQIEEMAQLAIREVEPDSANVDKSRQAMTRNGDESASIALHVQAFDHHDLFREDRGRAAVEEGEEGFDEEMGGATQNLVAIFEEGVTMLPENPQDGSMDGPDSGDLNDSFLSVRAEPSTRHNHGLRTRTLRQHDEAVPPLVNGVFQGPTAIGVAPLKPAARLEEPDWIIDPDTDPSTDNIKEHGQDLLRQKKSTNRATWNPLDEGNGTTRDSYMAEKNQASSKKVRSGNTSTAGPKINLFGRVSNQLNEKDTAFSAADLFLPSYKTKRKKKKGST